MFSTSQQPLHHPQDDLIDKFPSARAGKALLCRQQHYNPMKAQAGCSWLSLPSPHTHPDIIGKPLSTETLGMIRLQTSF